MDLHATITALMQSKVDWHVARHVVLAPGSEDAMFAAVCRLARISRERRKGNFVRYEGGDAMIGPIGVYLLRFPGAVPHPKPPCEAGAAAGLVIQNVPPLLG